MKVKRFVADNMQLALKMVSAELGPDAVIVSSRRLDNGMEVVASSEMLGEIDTAKQSELDRQLRLQRELEAAKQAARASAAQRQEHAADTAAHYAPQQRASQQGSAQVSRNEGMWQPLPDWRSRLLKSVKNQKKPTRPACRKCRVNCAS